MFARIMACRFDSSDIQLTTDTDGFSSVLIGLNNVNGFANLDQAHLVSHSLKIGQGGAGRLTGR